MIFFAVVVNFFSSNWELKHITIGLFEANDNNGGAMIMKLKQVLDKFHSHKILWPMSRTKGSICKLVQWLSTQLCFVMALA
jgi:hypothetical protein